MNYRHAYHAGNFADVLKHIVLTLCLVHLKRKVAPFRIIDTHAGAGRYRLDQSEAETTGEWRSGVAKIFGADAEALSPQQAGLMAPYRDALAADNPDGALKVYPGSPALVQAALRATDALVANELHPEMAQALRKSLGKDKLCKVSTMDGYAALKALLPPKERRGLVLIDPPFEEPGELVRMTDALGEALKRFATGTYLLWYPIKDEKPVERFHRGVLEVTAMYGVAAPLKVELLLRPARNPLLLNGCGLVVVNAPFTLETDLRVLLPMLNQRLGETGTGLFRLGLLAAKAAPSAAMTARRGKPRLGSATGRTGAAARRRPPINS